MSEPIIEKAGGVDAAIGSRHARERLDLRMRPSAWISALLVGVHGAATALVWSAPRWPWLCVAATLLTCASLARSLRRARAPFRLMLEGREDGAPSARVYLRGGREMMGFLHGSTFVSVPLVILRVRTSGLGRCASVLVPRGSIGAHAHRRLRVWLRWCAVPGLRRNAGAQ